MLNALIPRPEDADDGAFCILNSTCKTENGISLELLFDPADGNAKQKWQVDCASVRESLFRDDVFGDAYVETEHPILKVFNEQRAELYFYSVPINISELIGDLFICHNELIDDWISFSRFFNKRPGGLPELLRLYSGLLAKGPHSFMQRYANILASHDVRHSLRLTGLPPVWNGEKWQEANSPAKLLVLGRSYIVADRFDTRRLEN